MSDYPYDPKATSCPKCGLEFKTLLHPFCQHKECPPREWGKQPRPEPPEAGPAA